MSEQGAQPIKVVLRWIQITDKMEPFFKETGEFVFRSRVTTGDQVVERRFPEEGYYAISDKPGWNRLEKMDRVLFEGVPGETMTVELMGVELDTLSADDHLDHYRREFTGPVESWLGHYEPADEGADDPENLTNWRVCYDILRA